MNLFGPLAHQPDIDGFLVGGQLNLSDHTVHIESVPGASLKAEFEQICKSRLN